MFRKLTILVSLMGAGQIFYADSAFAMEREQDWQKARIERTIAILQQELNDATSKGDEARVHKILDQLQEEYNNLDRHLNPPRALPGAVQDKTSHLYQQQHKGDEGLAIWQQKQADKESAKLKAARLAEEERLAQIELDRVAAERREPPAPNPTAAEDESIAQGLHQQEQERVRRERAEHESAGEEAARRLQAEEQERVAAEQERRVRENVEGERAGEVAARRLQAEEAARGSQLRQDVEYDSVIAQQMQAEEEARARHRQPPSTASDEEIARQLARDEFAALERKRNPHQ